MAFVNMHIFSLTFYILMSLLLMTVTLRGVSNKHCLLSFFSFFSDFLHFDMSPLLLTVTLRGVSNKHCLLSFSLTFYILI